MDGRQGTVEHLMGVLGELGREGEGSGDVKKMGVLQGSWNGSEQLEGSRRSN